MGMVPATKKYVAVMTHFFGNLSARPPMRRRPPMLDHRMRTDAVRHAASTFSPLVKPWSRKTNFMWKLMAPMEPMEQKLPMSSSQKGQLRNNCGKVRDFTFDSADGCGRPSGFC